MAASPQFPKIPKDWKEQSLYFNNETQHLRIYHNQNLKKGRLLFLVHGQAEQSDRYEHFPHYLNNVVDCVACLDLPGHGLSKGIRGHVESFDDYSQACLLGLETARKWLGEKAQLHKTHWLGHSLGGLVTLRTLLSHPELKLDSVIVSAALLDLAFPVPKVKSFFGQLTEPLLGRVKLSNELDAKWISRDPAVVQEYSRNPLNHKYVTPRFFVNLLKEMTSVRANNHALNYNLLMEVPLADAIVSSKAQCSFFSSLKMTAGHQKELVTFPGYFHESFNDLDKDRPFLALENWLNRH